MKKHKPSVFRIQTQRSWGHRGLWLRWQVALPVTPPPHPEAPLLILRVVCLPGLTLRPLCSSSGFPTASCPSVLPRLPPGLCSREAVVRFSEPSRRGARGQVGRVSSGLAASHCRTLFFSRQVVSGSCDPWTAARQASPSFTISQSLPKFMCIQLVLPCSDLISVAPFSSCPQPFPASESFPTSRQFAASVGLAQTLSYSNLRFFIQERGSKVAQEVFVENKTRDV